MNYVHSSQLSVEIVEPSNYTNILIVVILLILVVAVTMIAVTLKRYYRTQPDITPKPKVTPSAFMTALAQADPVTQIYAIYGVVEADQNNVLGTPELVTCLTIILRHTGSMPVKGALQQLLSLKIIQKGEEAIPFLTPLLKSNASIEKEVAQRIAQEIQLHRSYTDFRLNKPHS